MDIDLFKLKRPLFEHQYDDMRMPIIKRDSFTKDELEKLEVSNLQNFTKTKNKKSKLILMFSYDKELERVWDNPFNYPKKFLPFLAVATPDFSIYSDMDYYNCSMSVYKNRWFGCFLQERGIRVIPTIQWCDEDTYDLCFSGVEKHSIVCISTLGCENDRSIGKFLKGYSEMMKRIEPSLVIVFGKPIHKMTGNGIIINYSDCFEYSDKSYRKEKLFEISNIINLDNI